jgi:sulfoxide reductase heme-binding subunit YedZ
MENESRWIDGLTLVLSVLIMGMAVFFLVHMGTFDKPLFTNNRMTWYLTRAAGTTAYILLTLSVLWGLALNISAVKTWSPGPLTMVLHATLSWAALGFGMIHGVILLFDRYYHYRVTDLLIPFTGPYRPVAVGLGIIGFWMLVVVTPSFALRRRLFSYRAWKMLHYTTYIAFLLVSAHGLTAGTDASRSGFRLLFEGSVLLTGVLLWYRIRASQRASEPTPSARPRRAIPPAAKPSSGKLR